MQAILETVPHPEIVLTWGPQEDESAEAEFVARSRIAGRGVRLHERSRFLRVDGRWYYVDGDFPG
nr:YchJ family metal-binding protein [Ectothiorhodospira sp. BSL-9]